MPPTSKSFRGVTLTRVRPDGAVRGRDVAATEEPLEIRLHGEPFAVIMRTPGDDLALAAGFLLAEQVLRDGDDLLTIEYCQDVDDEAAGNVVNVRLDDRRAAELPGLLESRRQIVTSASCGLCGRRTIESLCLDRPPIVGGWTIESARVVELPSRLRRAQAAFEETGGLHAAGLFSPLGELDGVTEDIGRHNAVDKVVGRALLDGALPLASRGLVVSGRVSFEIVQKAIVAGVPMIAAVSAPSTLAVDLADEAGVTLLGFVRGERFNIYAHPERVHL